MTDPTSSPDPTPEPWERDLARLGSGVRPSSPMAGPVREAVRRRVRRRRTWTAVLGSAGLVAVVAVAASALGDGKPVPVEPLPATTTPSTPPTTPSPPPDAAGGTFACALESTVFGDPPPIPDLVEQQEVVGLLASLSSVQVVHAEPTALGVVALVADDSGDRDYWADPAVADRLRNVGAAFVYEWDPSGVDVGLDAAAQVQQVLGWQLEPVVADVRAAVRGIPGDAGLALWQEAGAVLLQWRAPVPPEVQALAGVRDDGVEVIVEAVTYSAADVERAQAALQVALADLGLRERWTSGYGCADGTGLVVGMVPPVQDRAALQEELAAAVGMPVMVVPEERPVELAGR